LILDRARYVIGDTFASLARISTALPLDPSSKFYDNDLCSISGKVGKNLGVKEIRKHIFDAIANAYPQYADECKRQMNPKQYEIDKVFQVNQ